MCPSPSLLCLAQVLDVARYKYPAVWVPSSTLFDSMSTLDSTSKLYRGFLVLKRSTLSECAHPSEAHDEDRWSSTNEEQEQKKGKKKTRKHKPVRITISDSALVASVEEEAMCPSGPL